MDKLKCKDCSWWKSSGAGPNNGEEKGKCRGRSPTVTVIALPQVNKISGEVRPQFIEITAWPATPANCGACGDFKTVFQDEFKH